MTVIVNLAVCVFPLVSVGRAIDVALVEHRAGVAFNHVVEVVPSEI